ncbi:dolichol kinase [Venturia canescens]|uniref:dolichol kinase n=1 Tax=Venturia canescens TaxID=32260 RepID=UPI001C9C9341|nr:dolichol kinase [Venturia canescens]
MDFITTMYDIWEEKILQTLNLSGIKHRENANSGLWLGPLIGLCAAATILREENSYSEICLIVGITGVGLVISCLCLYTRLWLLSDKTDVRDFQILYFLPSGVSSMLFLLWANKGLLASVSWGLGVGTMSTWGVVQTMSCFPGCFTIGEATTVMHGIILFILSAVTNLPLRYHLPPIHDDDIATTILQVGMLYVALNCLLCGFFPKLRSTKNFYLLIVGGLALLLVPVLHILLDRSPLVWIVLYVFGSLTTIILLLYWAFCLVLGIGVLAYQILLSSHATSVTRKSFHLLAVLVYVPGFIWQPTFLHLASGIVMGLFVMLELMRFFRIPPLAEALEKGFSVFADEKDSSISLTPLYLLAGISFPLWMPTTHLELLPLMSGVLTVGLGDSAASFFGTKWGKNKWPGSEKTIEGTAACIASQLLFIYSLGAFGFTNGFWPLVRGTLAVTGISLVEARTNQVDNLALPLLMYFCLVI